MRNNAQLALERRLLNGSSTMQRLAISLLTALTMTACGTSPQDGSGDGGDWGEGLGDPENPVPQSAEDGPYATRTMMDFTAEQLLPPQVESIVVTLRAFGENPGRGLIVAADEAGLPVFEELYDALPGALRDRFEGWINDEVAKLKINGKTLPQYSAEVAKLAEFALTKFALDSELALQPGHATHTLTALDLSPTGLVDIRVPISGLAADILTQHPTVEVGPGGALLIGDQTFGLRIGEYAWDGVNQGVAQLFGGDIRASLGKVVNCSTIANNVANKCVLGVCVGHETEIKAICTGALDLVVAGLHAGFAKLNLDAFHMATGDAVLVDDDGDGIGDRIIDGIWDSEMNIGLGLRKAPSTFTATRQGGAPVTQ